MVAASARKNEIVECVAASPRSAAHVVDRRLRTDMRQLLSAPDAVFPVARNEEKHSPTVHGQGPLLAGPIRPRPSQEPCHSYQRVKPVSHLSDIFAADLSGLRAVHRLVTASTPTARIPRAYCFTELRSTPAPADRRDPASTCGLRRDAPRDNARRAVGQRCGSASELPACRWCSRSR